MSFARAGDRVITNLHQNPLDLLPRSPDHMRELSLNSNQVEGEQIFSGCCSDLSLSPLSNGDFGLNVTCTRPCNMTSQWCTEYACQECERRGNVILVESLAGSVMLAAYRLQDRSLTSVEL